MRLTCNIKLNISLYASNDELFIVIFNNYRNKLQGNDRKIKVLFTIEAVTRSCSIKKVLLNVFRNNRKTSVPESLL